MCFMDGSFMVRAYSKTNDLLELIFLDDSASEEESFFVMECPKEDLKKDLLVVASKVLKKAEVEQWPTTKMQGLKNCILAIED